MRATAFERVRAVFLASAVALPFGVNAIEPVAPDSDAATERTAATASDWRPFMRSETLGDGSILTEYAVRARSPGPRPAELTLSFSPRFDCEPMIGFRFDAELAPSLADDGGLSVRIDGVRIGWPGQPGERGAADSPGEAPRPAGETAAAWLYADRQVRRTVRLRIDIGDALSLRMNDGMAINFSLLGSRDGAAAAESACRSHTPIPFDGL